MELDSLNLGSGRIVFSKEDLTNRFGTGIQNYTDYECGFNSNDQAGAPYYQLKYDQIIFIGSDTYPFILENFTFTESNKHVLSYNDSPLNQSTTVTEFIEIFGKYAKEHFQENPKSDSILLFFENADDGVRFNFSNGKLISYEYWSPC
ncbi:hypothetical protein [Bacterioplanoides sp.]|uniref:hypothetical protein n=1 Tax=Bacterioplanoides sp. TaxID=2066072 RepID=UPI003B59E0ED